MMERSQAHVDPPRETKLLRTKLLLIDPDEVHLRWMARAVQQGVSDIEVHPRTSSARDGEPYDLVVMSQEGGGSEMSAKQVLNVRQIHPEVPFLLVSSGKHLYRQLLAGSSDLGLMNVLARKQAGWALPIDFIVTLQKLTRPDIFGIDRYLPRGTVEPLEMIVRSTADKREALERAQRYVAALAVHPRLMHHLLTVIDEAVSNALYHGPCDEAGRGRFAHLPREADLSLADGEQLAVTVRCDGERIGVSVADPFGSLTRGAIFDHLSKCFRGGRDRTELGPESAGIGLYLCFEALSHLVINLSPGRRTEVIGLIDVRDRYLDYVNMGKSFNVFEASEGGAS
jgi:hypothetical protein